MTAQWSRSRSLNIADCSSGASSRTSYLVPRTFCCHHSHKFAEPRHGSTWSSQCTRGAFFSRMFVFVLFFCALKTSHHRLDKEKKNKTFADDIDSLLFHLQVRDQVWDKEEPVLLSSRGSCPDWRSYLFRVCSGASRWRTLISDYFCNNGFWMNGDVACARTSCQGLFILKFGGKLGFPHSLHVWILRSLGAICGRGHEFSWYDFSMNLAATL